MQLCNTVAKSALLVIAIGLLAVGVIGSYLMWSVIQHDTFDSDYYMMGLAFVMFSVTCLIGIQQVLKKIILDIRKDVKASFRRMRFIIRKAIAFKKKGVCQQA